MGNKPSFKILTVLISKCFFFLFSKGISTSAKKESTNNKIPVKKPWNNEVRRICKNSGFS